MSVPEPFVPLALQPGWILESHLGWCVLEEGPALKILTRRYGPLRRLLLLAHGADATAVSAAACRQGALAATAFTTLVDFGGPQAGLGPATRDVAGQAFTRAEGDRFFGVGTFVIDLAEDEALLWSRLSSGKRKEVRHVERAGVRALCGVAQARDLDDFARLHARLARRKRLDAAPIGALGRMAAQGELLACRARDAAGATLVLNLLYLGHAQGYFLYGARAEDVPAGVGMLAQWEGLRALQARGCRSYDLGLVASTDASDGVYRFKRALGGRFVAYGEEYRNTPAWLRLPQAALRRLRG